MLSSFLFAALVALTPTAANPAPSPSAAPVLQEIAHVRASACQTLVSHANVAIEAAQQNDMELLQTIRALHSTHLNGNVIERRNSLQQLENLAKDIHERADAGDKEIKELRRTAAATSDPKKKQELLDFANALGGAIRRQYLISRDLDGFTGNLEARDMARPDSTLSDMNVATTGSPNTSPGATDVTANRPLPPGYGSSTDRTQLYILGTNIPDDDGMAVRMAEDFISQIPDIRTDEATATAHADGATSGC